MALEIVWTKQAEVGYGKVIQYLEANFSEKEIRNFVKQSNDFFNLLSQFPEMLESSRSQKNIRRGPINKFTLLTYRVDSKKHRIELINIRFSRQSPIK